MVYCYSFALFFPHLVRHSSCVVFQVKQQLKVVSSKEVKIFREKQVSPKKKKREEEMLCQESLD